MSFLLNNTRCEAVLIPEDEEDPEYLDTQRLTKPLGPYACLIKDWSFTDDILIYQPLGDVSYYTLGKYKPLNFITYNREAHLVDPEPEKANPK